MYCFLPTEKRVRSFLIVAIVIMSLALMAAAGPSKPASAHEAKLTVTVDAAGGKVKKVTIAGSKFYPNEMVTMYFVGKCYGVKEAMDFPLGIKVKGKKTDEVKADESGAFSAALTKRHIKRLPKLCFERGQNVYTLKALGSKGSVATAPLVWPKKKKK